MIFNRSSAGLFISTVTVSLLTFVTGLIIARYLGPDARGYLASITVWPMVVAGVLGLSGGVVCNYRIASDHRTELKQDLVTFYFCVSVLFSSISCLFYIKFSNSAGLWPFIAFITLAFTEMFRVACLGVFSGQKRFVRLAIFRVITPTIYFFAILFCFATDNFTAEAVLASLIFSNIVFTLLLSHFIDIQASLRFPFLQEILTSIYRFHPTTIVHVVRSNLEKVACVIFLPLNDVGAYFAITALMMAPFQAMQQTIGAQILTASANSELTKNNIIKLNTCIALFIMLLSIMVYMYSDMLVNVVLGKKFSSYTYIASFVFISSGIKFLSNIQIAILQGKNSGRIPLTSELIYVFIFAVLIALSKNDLFYLVIVSFITSFITMLYLLKNTLSIKH